MGKDVWAVAVLVFLILIGTGTSGTKTAMATELFESGLFALCTPMAMDFAIASQPEKQTTTGLTEKAIANAVEARLRAARLFGPTLEQFKDKDQYLFIGVNVVGDTFSIGMELRRYLEDLGYGFGGVAAVWVTGVTGKHGDNGQYIIGALSSVLDHFIASYLRVNEAHCSK